MEYYNLPQTNLKVSKVALGCMRIASKTPEEVEKLVLTSLIMLIFMVVENQKNYSVKYYKNILN